MGLIRENFGKITIEQRKESFIIHPSYGYDRDGNGESNDYFEKHWRETPHPEFLLSDLDDLIKALRDLRNYDF